MQSIDRGNHRRIGRSPIIHSRYRETLLVAQPSSKACESWACWLVGLFLQHLDLSTDPALPNGILSQVEALRIATVSLGCQLFVIG